MKNEYLESLNKKEKAYIKKREAIKKEASNIVAHYGVDSAEYEECSRRYKALGGNPVSRGEKCAYGALNNSNYWNSSEFEMSGFLWEQDIHDFVTALRNAGIKTFAFTNQSTAVMADMCGFSDEGCTFIGFCTVTRTGKDDNGDDISIEVRGVRFAVN